MIVRSGRNELKGTKPEFTPPKGHDPKEEILEVKLKMKVDSETFYKSESFFSEYDEIECTITIKEALPKAELLEFGLYFKKGECKVCIQIVDKKEEILLRSA